jgi:hypothetical protein
MLDLSVGDISFKVLAVIIAIHSFAIARRAVALLAILLVLWRHRRT